MNLQAYELSSISFLKHTHIQAHLLTFLLCRDFLMSFSLIFVFQLEDGCNVIIAIKINMLLLSIISLFSKFSHLLKWKNNKNEYMLL